LQIVQLNGRRTPKDIHRDPQLGPVFINFFHHSKEVPERSFFDANFSPLSNKTRDGVCGLAAPPSAEAGTEFPIQANRSDSRPPKNPVTPGGVSNHPVGLVVHVHVNQHIAREKFPFLDLFFIPTKFHHIFRRDQELKNPFVETLLNRRFFDQALTLSSCPEYV
jgi:hypothetical protein